MVSSILKKAWVNLSLSMLFIFVFSFDIRAQKISKYYISSLQQRGTLYFIHSHLAFKAKRNRATFTYDITYLSSSDSALVNFSYYEPINQNISAIDSVQFIYSDHIITSNAKKIFIEPKKKYWQYRYSLNFLFKDLNKLYFQDNPPRVILYRQKKSVELNVSKQIWQRQASIIQRIFALIESNR